MNILGIESSCDETAAAVVSGGRNILSNVVLSQVSLHAAYGGVVPELASRRHAECIDEITRDAVNQANLPLSDIDAVAVTAAPGLIGALLVGVNFAKGLSYSIKRPLIPVHHIRAHVAANFLAHADLEPPFLALVVSGGHSSILEVRTYTDYRTVGVTRDDAAGECFDKLARVLGLGYPGGPAIDRAGRDGDPARYKLPSPRVEGFNFSFSGVKTAALNIINSERQRGEDVNIADMCASLSHTVARILAEKTFAAARELGHKTIALAGGVAANSVLRQAFADSDYKLYIPPITLCGDNAAMVAAQGCFEYISEQKAPLGLNARATCPADQKLC